MSATSTTLDSEEARFVIQEPSPLEDSEKNSFLTRSTLWRLCIFAASALLIIVFPHFIGAIVPTHLPLNNSTVADGDPLSAQDGAGTRLWRTWEAVNGTHPLCEPSFLRAALDSAPWPSVSSFSGSHPRAAAVSVVGRYPGEAVLPGSKSIQRISQRLLEFFPSQDEFFFAPFGIDFVLLIQEGVGADCEVLDAAHALNWTSWRSGNDVQGCRSTTEGERNSSNNVLASHATGVFRSAQGTRIIVKARNFALPRYLQRDLSLLNRPDWLGCVGLR